MHRAGARIRAFREAHDPPLTAAEFGERYGDPEPWPSRTVYGWEAKGRIARAAVQRRLSDLGICQPADWLEPVSPHPEINQGATPMSQNDTHPFYDLHTHGFVRVATATPSTRTADVAFNAAGILEQARLAHDRHVDLLLYPELSLSSYAIDDLHLQTALLDAVERQLGEVCQATRGFSPVLVIGALEHRQSELLAKGLCGIPVILGQLCLCSLDAVHCVE